MATPGLHVQGSSDDRRACHRALLDALRDEMAHRHRSTGLEWVDRERWAITLAAQQWAEARSGLRRVDVDDVERIEHRACGHVDYASKLALYVMELIYGIGGPL